jgi:hypothetical protein
MAGASLLLLIDDIASALDDVAAMTKVAAKKTAGVLGDDLALNAEQVSGVRAERELPVVWAVAVGSLKNKLILVPAALAISLLMPWAILPLLMIMVSTLFRRCEKLAHKFLHRTDDAAGHHVDTVAAESETIGNLAELEAEKVKGAIRTDFVLSAEIIVIALGTVSDKPFMTQLAVLAGIGLIMTVGVYGIVAGIVKLDDLGFYLLRKRNALARQCGRLLVQAAPWLMKALTIIGTAAMFMVGGSIIAHGIPAAHHAIELATEWAATSGGLSMLLKVLTPVMLDMVVGFIGGVLALAGVKCLSALGRIRKGGPQ